MPPHKTAALFQYLQHHRAIPEFVNLQHRPFLRPGERIANIRECQGRQGLAGCLQLPHLRRFPLSLLRVLKAGRQFEGTTTCRSHCRSGVSGKCFKQSRPLQHHRSLFEKIHRCLTGKCLTIESTNSNEPGDRDARHRSADLAPILSASDSGDRETSVIRRRVTTLVWLDKAQERRYYRRHSGR